MLSLVSREKGDREESRILFIFGLKDEAETQMCNAQISFMLKGRWILVPNLLLVSKRIQLLDPLLADPCNTMSQYKLDH